MTDHDEAIALVIDAAQLVSQADTRTPLTFLRDSSIPHVDLQRAALTAMAGVFSGDHAAERFDELRRTTLALAVDHGAQDRQVELNLETISTAQALAAGDYARANAIVAGSEFTAVDIAWCAVCLTGQCVRGWVGEHHLTEFWSGLRRHYGRAA